MDFFLGLVYTPLATTLLSCGGEQFEQASVPARLIHSSPWPHVEQMPALM
jgi:hypothetical protein